MGFLDVLLIIVHIVLAIGVIFFALQRMQKNSEIGGAFGAGAAATNFGREKGLDKASKLALTLGILFMFSCFLVTWILS
ncbi:preprotein translocase subunit SecG [Petrotoga sp. 9PWA.NaAc.5.4]|uniref:preprotein translocase subunit SecG n=1 Tax=Petrotoga sp. 9PWA.NaAc.5.4 TaxID=1434328 RepID=UPI000CBBF073|nr:preprotein translocase subunit SecG [Petrotoga sp. 9PWA.NaAc.5.4]PNR95735.1 preprotein translocase subunit SecG [Petrotoga sp. 9PWA.NaAc.5.4]